MRSFILVTLTASALLGSARADDPPRDAVLLHPSLRHWLDAEIRTYEGDRGLMKHPSLKQWTKQNGLELEFGASLKDLKKDWRFVYRFGETRAVKQQPKFLAPGVPSAFNQPFSWRIPYAVFYRGSKDEKPLEIVQGDFAVPGPKMPPPQDRPFLTDISGPLAARLGEKPGPHAPHGHTTLALLPVEIIADEGGKKSVAIKLNNRWPFAVRAQVKWLYKTYPVPEGGSSVSLWRVQNKEGQWVDQFIGLNLAAGQKRTLTIIPVERLNGLDARTAGVTAEPRWDQPKAAGGK